MNSNSVPKLGRFKGSQGYISSAPKETEGDYMSKGSENAMLTGSGKVQNFKGMTERPTQAGGIIMQNVAENYASLGTSTAVLPALPDVTAYGNVFNVFSALFFIGKGRLFLNGVSLLATAAATLQLLIKTGGVYTVPGTGPYQAGLVVPSAPTIRAVTPPAGFTGKVNGVVSVVIWRIRSSTGATSNRSPVSNFVGATNQAIAVTLPAIDTNGQDYWGIGVTKHAEGEVGSHFELMEIPESTVSQTLVKTNAVTSNASFDVTSALVPPANAPFSSAHIGWTATFTGGTPATSFTSYVTAVPSATTITLAATPPTSSTGVTMTLASGVTGSPRTVTIEWRDGDLFGKPFAPSRSFPPPPGLFAGALEDITFVDGCYADVVTGTSSAGRGSSIAPSEKGKPESFSPDSAIPTNSIPTALVRGDGLYWRLSRNDVMVLRYLPGENPLSVEIVWEGIGVEFQHNASLGEGGRLYLWPSERGAMRMGDNGLPDTGFATEVSDDLAVCTVAAKRVVGWYGLMQVVCFCYEKTIWPYFTALERWGAPINLTGRIDGNIKSCVSDNNLLLISDDLDNLYEFNVGTGSVMKIMSPWVPSQESLDTVYAVTASVRADNSTNPVVIDTFADGIDSAPIQSISVTPSRTGYQRLPTVYPNVIDCTSHAVRVTITSNTATGDSGLEVVESFGPSTSVLV